MQAYISYASITPHINLSLTNCLGYLYFAEQRVRTRTINYPYTPSLNARAICYKETFVSMKKVTYLCNTKSTHEI